MAAASPRSDGSSGKRKARVSGATTTPRPSDGSSPSSDSRTVISSDPSWWSTVQEAPGSYLASSTWLLAGARPRRSARSGPIRPPWSTRSTRGSSSHDTSGALTTEVMFAPLWRRGRSGGWPPCRDRSPPRRCGGPRRRAAPAGPCRPAARRWHRRWPPTSWGGASRPLSPWRTRSSIPPTGVATTASPLAIASASTLGTPSRSPSAVTHGVRANTWARASSAATSS